MEIRKLDPYVRFARVQWTPLPGILSIALDHRFLWCQKGEVTVRVRDEEYLLKEGSLLFFRAGIPYRRVSEGQSPVLLGCNFDMFYQKEAVSPPVSYVQAEIYSEDMLLEPTLPPADADFPDIIFLPYAPFKDTLEKIIRLYDHPSHHSEELSGTLLKSLLIEMVRLYRGGNLSDIHRVDAVLDYIKEHYRENLTNLMLAKKFSYHPNYISRLVKDHTGMTLHRYLLDYRIKKALLFLKSGEYNVSDAASAVGFSDIKHFSKCFRRHMGCPPSTFLPVANDKT